MNEKALNVINKNPTITIATVDKDGSPRSTIVFGKVDGGAVTWYSSTDTIHSQNIERDGRVALSAYCEDTEPRSYLAVYAASSAKKTGNQKFDERFQKTTHEYSMQLGEYDAEHSTENRFYFKENSKVNL